MSEARYEDYSKLNGRFSCTVNSNIKRTSHNLSDMANWHNNIEIQRITSGSGFVILDNEKTNVSTGDIIVVNSEKLHYTGTDDEITYDCIILDNYFCRYIGIDDSICFEELIRDDVTESKIQAIIEHYNKKGESLWEAKLSAMLIDLLIILAENFKKPVHQTSANTKRFDEIKKAILFIQKNYSQKITLEQIAKQVLLDRFTLSRDFKRITNMTVFEYINRYRIHSAVSMIESGRSVSETAELCGYNNLSFFIKTFKKYTGNRPSFYK